MPKLSVVIITHNEEKNILRCLESVKPVADEIVVVDSMSTDLTVTLCREFGCRVFQHAFEGFGTQHQYAVDQASNDWVLSVDADEVVTEELQHEINRCIRHQTLSGQPGHGEEKVQIPAAAYRIPFSLHFMGKLLRHGGVGNEYHLRLFDRNKGGYTTVPVHEGVDIKGEIGVLQGRIIHYSYRDISHHIEKINNYTTLAADGYVNRGRSFSKWWVPLKFPVSLFSFYIIKGGFLDGYPGFMWSFLAAVYATLKIAKTIERTKNT